MKDKIMSFQELDNYRRNLNSLELRVGYKVPGYVINNDELSDKILNINEIDTLARNIESIELMNNRIHKENITKRSWIDYYPIYILIIILVGSVIQMIFN